MSAERITEQDEASEPPRRRLRPRTRAGRRNLFLILLTLVCVTIHECAFVRPAKNRALAARAELEARGVPTTVEAFNEKYPVSREGEYGVFESALFLRAIEDQYLFDLEYDPGAPDSGIPATEFPLLLREILNQSGYDEVDGKVLDERKIGEYLERHADILARAEGWTPPVGYRELGWVLSLETPAPISGAGRRFGNEEVNPGGALNMQHRITARVFLPLRIRDTLKRGETEEAWRQIEHWLYLARAMEREARSVVAYLLAAAFQEIAYWNIEAVLKETPPSREAALRIIDYLDPAESRFGYLRAMDAEIIRYQSYLSIWAMPLAPPPVMSDFDLRFASDFSDQGIKPRDNWLIVNARPLFRWQGWSAKALLWRLRDVSIMALDHREGSTEFPSTAEPLAAASSRQDNPFTNGLVPALTKVAVFCRYSMSHAALLRCALLLRVAELDAGGDPGLMPLSIEELFIVHGLAPPEDLMGAAGALIEYQPDRETGTFTLSQAPDPDSHVAEQRTRRIYRGSWSGSVPPVVPESARDGVTPE